MRNLIVILTLVFISCQKEEMCPVINETCVVTTIVGGSRCMDDNGDWGEWGYETEIDTFYLRCRSSKDALFEMEDEITSVTCF